MAIRTNDEGSEQRFCIRCGQRLAGASPKFCAGCGSPTVPQDDASAKATPSTPATTAVTPAVVSARPTPPGPTPSQSMPPLSTRTAAQSPSYQPRPPQATTTGMGQGTQQNPTHSSRGGPPAWLWWIVAVVGVIVVIGFIATFGNHSPSAGNGSRANTAANVPSDVSVEFIVGGMGCPLIWNDGEDSGLKVQIRSDSGALLGQGPLRAHTQAAINCKYRAAFEVPQSPDGWYVVDVGPGMGKITYSSSDVSGGRLSDTLTVNQ